MVSIKVLQLQFSHHSALSDVFAHYKSNRISPAWPDALSTWLERFTGYFADLYGEDGEYLIQPLCQILTKSTFDTDESIAKELAHNYITSFIHVSSVHETWSPLRESYLAFKDRTGQQDLDQIQCPSLQINPNEFQSWILSTLHNIHLRLPQ